MHPIERIGLALAAGVALASCTSTVAPPIKPNTPLVVAWQTRVGDSINQIALHDGLAFVVNEQNHLTALDVTTGAKRWEKNLNLINSRDNAVSVEEGYVFALTGRDAIGIISFNAQTGQVNKEIPNATHKTAPFPSAGGHKVFFETPPANGTSSLRTSHSSNDKDFWTFRLDGTLATAVIYRDGAALFGVNVWEGANVKSRRLVALDAATGALKWEQPLDLNFAGGITADANRIFIGLDGGVVQARDTATGDALWTAQIGGRISAAPSVHGDVVFATNSDGVIAALDANDGTKRWSQSVNSAILTQVAIADGVAYFGTNDGFLHALDAATGVEKWKVQSPERRPTVPGPYVPAMGVTPVVAGDLLLYFNGDALNALKLR